MGASGLDAQEQLAALAEVNSIWLTQAGVCFEAEVVRDDDARLDGFDLSLGPGDDVDFNGVYRNDHDIFSRDRPNLGPAPRPVKLPVARTVAHELGHGLRLPHDQSSDDLLMRSGTLGWQLTPTQIETARGRAREKALPDTAPLTCGAAVVR